MGNTLTRERDDHLETFRLIWLDSSVNNSEENLRAQQRLRKTVNYLKTFDGEQVCLKYIRSVPEDDRIILIVSGELGRILVPKISRLRQVFSIYIYCNNKIFHEHWSQHYYQVIQKKRSFSSMFHLMYM